MFDGKAFGAEMTEVVKGYVDRATAPLLKRIEELEARKPERGEKGDPGEPGERGERGETGVGVAGALIDRSGVLILTLSDGTQRDLGPVVGKDGSDGLNGADGAPGEPGKDGQDGFSLDDFDCEAVDERTIKLMFTRGDTLHSYELAFPIPIYRNVFKEGETYVRGDIVTWGGQAWHCEKDTTDKPCIGDSWAVMVKKGRDGKDAK